MKLKCPRCGNFVDTGNAPPGSAVTCSCGNVLSVPARSKTPWWVFLLIGGIACVPCTGILAAIAIPNFIRFQSRAKQSECRSYLRTFYTSAKLNEQEGLTTDMEKLSFRVDPGNRYAYFTSFDPNASHASIPVDPKWADKAISADEARSVALKAGVTPGIEGKCPDCKLTAVCVGNIDGDATLDVWSVSTGDRTTYTGIPIAAGEVYHHVDDVTE